jgi:hypothetical protein
MRIAARVMIGSAQSIPMMQRYAIYTVFIALWATGCIWLILDLAFSAPGEFGPVPHPAQPALLLAHGVIALGALYLLGWVAARHAAVQWRLGKRRVSGGVFTGLMTVLTLSGCALFFISEDKVQHLAAVTHEVLGVAFTAFALEHWFFRRCAG